MSQHPLLFKIGDLLQITGIKRRTLKARERRFDIKRPPDDKWRKQNSLFNKYLVIVTERYTCDQFYSSKMNKFDMSKNFKLPERKDDVYICFAQKTGEYFLLHADELAGAEEEIDSNDEDSTESVEA